MEAPIFLTPAEIIEITRAKRSSTQVKRLREMGFTVRVRSDNSPLVAREHFLKAMDALHESSQAQISEPNMDAL